MQPAQQGVAKKLDEKETKEAFVPNTVEKKATKYIERRIDEMIDFRQSLGLEKRWKEADEEYIPHELSHETKRKRFEQDQDTGRRSRMVPIGDATQQWRSDVSAPTLLAKIQTAVGIVIDQQPEANLTALVKKYEATTAIAYSLWKRNWSITDAKEKLKLVIFDGIKYGWMVQRTAPREVCYDKSVLTFKDSENPENDRYVDKKVYWFKDVDRERLDPFRTWVDELSKPYDPYSTNETYHEFDVSWDSANIELKKYKNWKFVKRDSQFIRDDKDRKVEYEGKEMRKRKDVVTLGIFESRHKDLFAIYAPKEKILVYLGPLPNDDGYLSITHSLWILRSSNLPYGVSLWEIIRQNKALFDKMNNMTMDQLVLSIMKFGFFSGTNAQVTDGRMEIIPGMARQLTSSTGKPEINWMEIPGPGKEAWEGLEKLQRRMDDDSGISPTLEGEITGKTLGEILHAKEGSLKRLKVPVENIAWLIEQDAYVTLSWMSQLYAVPTVMEFASVDEMRAYEQENQVNHSELFGVKNPDTDETGGPYEAHYLPQLSLHLEGSDGELKESKKTQWFQIGKDIDPLKLKWKGIFKVLPRSIVDSSQTLVKATKMEMSNMLVPLFAMPPEIVAKAAEQICKINEEDPKDWLPDTFIAYLETAGQPVAPELLPEATEPPAMIGENKGMPPIFIPEGGAIHPETIQAQTGAQMPQPQTIVPKSEAPGPKRSLGVFNRRL